MKSLIFNIKNIPPFIHDFLKKYEMYNIYLIHYLFQDERENEVIFCQDEEGSVIFLGFQKNSHTYFLATPDFKVSRAFWLKVWQCFFRDNQLPHIFYYHDIPNHLCYAKNER